MFATLATASGWRWRKRCITSGVFMAATDEETATADYRELVGRINAELHDLRGAEDLPSRAGPC